jgi:hypothetical protein
MLLNVDETAQMPTNVLIGGGRGETRTVEKPNKAALNHVQYNGPPFSPEDIKQMAQSLIQRYGKKRHAERHAMDRQNNT